MYSFLPASWAGDTHEETDVLPIGDQEKGECLLNHHTDSLEAGQVLMAKYCRQAESFLRGKGKFEDEIASDKQELA